MIGEQVGKVIQTRNGEFPLGTVVTHHGGWRSHYVSNGKDLAPITFDLGNSPTSHCIGTLGMPG
jgi:NADPH-dependent curcumin reductase CurA